MSEMDNGRPMIHAQVELSVDPNCTTAFITITAPENGGTDITYERVKAALDEKFIHYGINEEAIRTAVDEKMYGDNICAASWLAPVDGVDGFVTYEFDTDSHLAPVEDEHGNVDFKDLGLVKNIRAGTLIGTITMPTEGTEGMDICGRPVHQRKGVPARLNLGKGTIIENEVRIVAAVDGNLRFSNGSFVVDEELFIKGDVDVSSGNIDFIGSVVIKGNVAEGYKVVSKKNISVSGSVTGAELIADGDISVRVGSINSTITCKGNCTLGFCESSNIHCEGTVESQSFVSGEVFAGKSIIASGKGIMMGGKYTALENIDASVIGSESYAKTVLTLGNNAVLTEERESHTRAIAEMEDKVDQLGKIVDTLTEMAKTMKLPPEREQMKMDAVRNKLKLAAEIKKCTMRIEEINKILEQNQNLSITCRRTIYPGVMLRINSCVKAVNQMNVRCRASIVGGDIAFIPL